MLTVRYRCTARKKITQWKNTYWQVLPHLEEYERTSAQFDHSVHSDDDNTSDDIDHEASRPKKNTRVSGNGRPRKGASYSKRDQALDKQYRGFKQLLAPFMIADSNKDDRLTQMI